ncbi:MAG: hypothetical protein ACOVO0_01120 [Burkholderiaceae bacterium]
MHRTSVFPSTATRLALAVCIATAFAPAHAQDVQPDTAPDLRVERITHEDAGSRVDEVRVGGVTRQIDVQTKSGLPGYQIQPSATAQGSATPAGERTGSQGSSGRASWRLFNF